ncbi:MAG: hypothetical protein QOH04_646 [Sphingomonadales bacterium]|jgi:EAL domain-containing protein (putative c-di-GMP-specific phosphodiesterase class I)|nr:hypothetical protein [Sphingomonadales bacterium]
MLPQASVRTIGDALSALPATPDATSDIRKVLGTIRTHLGMDVAFASEFTGGRRVFRAVDAAQDDCPVVAGASDPLEDTYCQRVVDGRMPEIIRDAASNAEAMSLGVTTALPVGAHVGVPLRLSDGRIYGTFCCFSYRPDPSLTERDLAMLRAFAEIAAGRLEEQMRRDTAVEERVGRIAGLLAEGGLMTVFQPIYDLKDGRAVGVEALSRFPDAETRPPSDWFAEAAEIGLGVDLEMVALRRALTALPSLPPDVYLAVNVSPAAILSGEVERFLDEAPANRLVLEITEHQAILDYVALARALDPLRRRARIAIDDVGAGYSGLRHILDLQPDLIKLDMSLTRDIDRDPARFALAFALAEFARGMGCELIAEGVETAGEMRALCELGVTRAQGYYLSRPLPLPRIQALLAAKAPSSKRPAPRGALRAAK